MLSFVCLMVCEMSWPAQSHLSQWWLQRSRCRRSSGMSAAGHAQAFLTPTHLAIAMEYAPGGELFNYLAHERRFSENKVGHYGRMYGDLHEHIPYTVCGAGRPGPGTQPSCGQSHVCRRATSSSSSWLAWITATPRCAAWHRRPASAAAACCAFEPHACHIRQCAEHCDQTKTTSSVAPAVH